MPHTKKTTLILLVAFALPGATEALGLGEIHVDSALNEPLAAEVDIVGATADDLAGITASIANRETFVRYGVDRPAFLSTATFRIAMDSKGQPVLAIRSTDAFTEPLINMLIDLRWHSGELIRQYTLLLDPVKFQPDTRLADAVPTGSGPGTYTATSQPASQPAPSSEQASPVQASAEQASPAVGEPVPPETVEVAARATLHGIASRVSSRGDAGPERMMIAIFRANPQAFEGNINRLRMGAVLTIPSLPEVSTISAADANHEIRLQMKAWLASTKFVGPAKHVALAVAATSKAPGGAASDDAALDRRVQMLEKGLGELQSTLDRERDTLAGIQARVAVAAETRAVTVAPPVAKSGHAIGAWVAAVLLLAVGAFGVLYAWRGRRILDTTGTAANAEAMPLEAVRTMDGLEVSALGHSSPNNAAPADKSDADTAKLQYRLIDLDGTGYHVPMPSILYEKGGFKERRTSLVDVLMVAVKREPNRRDLRMKLLETYYAAAATGRQGFLEVAQSLAGERKNMTDGEWAKITGMGRQIAADNDLFATDTVQADNKDLATCA